MGVMGVYISFKLVLLQPRQIFKLAFFINIQRAVIGPSATLSYPAGPITARYNFMLNAYWDVCSRREVLYLINERLQ